MGIKVVAKRGKRRKQRPSPRAPDRYLTHEQRLAVRTSKLWLAGYPRLVAQWHPTKNGDLYPSEVRYASNIKIWWKCPEGPDHEWQAAATHRTRAGTGEQKCPFCAGRRVSVTNSLKNIAPHVAKELHPTKNEELKARAISSQSTKKVWWQCPVASSHVYAQSISLRVRLGIGCPYCAHKRVGPEQSLAAIAPRAAKRWHPTKNGAERPTRVSARSAEYAWFLCPKGHSFQTKIKRMAEDERCPYCEGWELAPDTSLAALRPELAAEWHPTKNGSTTPAMVTPRRVDEAWWQCPKGRDHVYVAQIHARAMRGRGCPFCDGKRLSATNSLAARYPQLAKEWHPKNRPLRPANVLSSDPRVVWWKCKAGSDHEWQESVRHRTRTGGTHCPFCRGHRLSRVTNSLAARYPILASQWHPTKNGKLTPKDVRAGERRRVWWKCPNGADHEWEATLPYRTTQNDKCPYCVGKRLSVTNSFAAKFPRLVQDLHPTKNLAFDPSRVHATTNRFVWWKCPAGDDHVWRTRIVQRTTHGTGCPFCAHRAVSRDNCLATRFPLVAREWDESKNQRSALEVTARSKQLVWWKCTVRGHSFQQRVQDRTRASQPGCPVCTGRKRHTDP